MNARSFPSLCIEKPKGIKIHFMKLTPREKEVLLLISEGYTDNDMANKLDLSYHTIRTHRQNLRSKLSAKNTAGMLKKASALNLI
jgi:DNA-binding CsgD family transcriptional regulator